MPALFHRQPGRRHIIHVAGRYGYRINELLRRCYGISCAAPIAGLAIRSPKGWRIYIALREMRASGMTYPQILAHETFHTRPFIGRSEILAHAIGGLHRRPGTLSWRYALHEVLRLATERPTRTRIEAAIMLALLTAPILLLTA